MCFSGKSLNLLPPDVTKFNYGWGSARPRWGSLQRSPRSPSLIERGQPLKEGGKGFGIGEDKLNSVVNFSRSAGEKRGKEGGKRRGPQGLIHTPCSKS